MVLTSQGKGRSSIFLYNHWGTQANREPSFIFKFIFYRGNFGYDQPRQHIKKQRHYFGNKGLLKAMVFPVVVDGCESWTIKKAERRRTDAFELWCWSRLLSPLDCKEIQPVHPKGNQSWIFIGRTDAEAETPILWLLDAKNWHIWKDSDAGKDWRQGEKGMTEDEMVGWHHHYSTQRTWVWVNSRSWW